LFSPFAAWFPGGATLSQPYLRLFPGPSQNRTSGFPIHPAPRLTIQIICMQVIHLNHLGEKVNSLPALSPIRVRSVIIGYHSLNSANVSPSTGD